MPEDGWEEKGSRQRKKIDTAKGESEGSTQELQEMHHWMKLKMDEDGQATGCEKFGGHEALSEEQSCRWVSYSRMPLIN